MLNIVFGFVFMMFKAQRAVIKIILFIKKEALLNQTVLKGNILENRVFRHADIQGSR